MKIARSLEIKGFERLDRGGFSAYNERNAESAALLLFAALSEVWRGTSGFCTAVFSEEEKRQGSAA